MRHIEKKTFEYRIIQCKNVSSAILISWNGLKKIVGDNIKPFDHYNKKYFNKKHKYGKIK